MDERVILGDTCVLEGAEWLAGYDARFAAAMAQTGPLPLRLKPEGFDQLLNAIIGQQVSVASANAIWARMVGLDLTSEDTIPRASDEDLRAAGLSQQKMRYARALAEARIDYDALREMPSDAVIKTLTQVTGIGQWTAEIYAMFSLGRADVFAHGDLALQEAARVLLDLEERPKEKQMKIIAADWSPWRSVAARVLWAYYCVVKSREGIR
ncbi:DNA-3-methyladenine glycosylase 2 family protein [bacterium]|nr:DNA-3-methyladenine glycosylase 2 family protein [bacterium]